MNADLLAWYFCMIMKFPCIGNQWSPGWQVFCCSWVTDCGGSYQSYKWKSDTVQGSFCCVRCLRTFSAAFLSDSTYTNRTSPLLYSCITTSVKSPCSDHPVWTPQNLIYDWQLIWRSQNTPAWPSERDSVGKNSSRPDSSPTVWPRRPAFICLHTLPPPKTH